MADLTLVDGVIKEHESYVLEFKSCRNGLSKDFWSTYSAFANTFGGTVYMGIDDATHEVIGIENPSKIVKEIWDLLNDRKKVSVNILSPEDVQTIRMCDRDVIRVSIPRAERRKRPVYINDSIENGTYKRNGEGDYHCSVSELKAMIRDSVDDSGDSSTVNEMELEDFDTKSIEIFRNMLRTRRPHHDWNNKNDSEFLRIIGACSKDEKGVLRPTVAGLLMFGYDYTIMREFPNFHLDYLEFADGSDRWTYRISSGTGDFSGNILSFAIEVSNRIALVNSHGKTLDKMVRIDDTPMMNAQRELLVNALTHADYSGIGGIRAEWRDNRFIVRNPGGLRIPLKNMLEGGMSDPRNPHLAVMMSLIGLCERAGGGVNSVVNTCRMMEIPDPEYRESSDPDSICVNLMTGISDTIDDLEAVIVSLIQRNPKTTINELSEKTGIERNKVSRIIKELKNSGKVQRIGGTRGYWEVSLDWQQM